MGSEIFLRSRENTDPRYGAPPDRREIGQLLRFGIVNLDKPRGPTSHQVVSWVKEILGVGKAGHGGTLDPKVSGVLPVALERSTRLVIYLLRSDKSYVAAMTLHGDLTNEEIDGILRSFQGPIVQTPPVKSAVKREPRERRIHHLKLLDRKGRDVLFEVKCEAGTYVRKLCSDMGEAMLVGANMSELRRIRAGGFAEEDACTLQDLRDAMHYLREEGDESEVRRLVRPVEEFVVGMPKIWVRDTAVEALCNGANLALPGVVKCEAAVETGGLVAILTLKEELVGVGVALMHAKEIFSGETGMATEVKRVVMDRGVYPRYWK